MTQLGTVPGWVAVSVEVPAVRQAPLKKYHGCEVFWPVKSSLTIAAVVCACEMEVSATPSVTVATTMSVLRIMTELLDTGDIMCHPG